MRKKGERDKRREKKERKRKERKKEKRKKEEGNEKEKSEKRKKKKKGEGEQTACGVGCWWLYICGIRLVSRSFDIYMYMYINHHVIYNFLKFLLVFLF